ncbi:Inorganic phosphate transport protein PHO88 AltName: Full=Phosphate metabolism protein PHO88 [Serendipita indica DSM 11827]|nr:Inorganic phosphate transport protein PHO88 AltName: Full=Phosphate metabolism protein PHO88 [Serendipita indica DSM 11827]
MNPAVQNLVISLGAMQVARKIPFEDPQVLMCASNVCLAYVGSLTRSLRGFFIKKKNDTTVLKYVEPKNALNPDSGGLVVTTNRDYDLEETSKLLRAVYMGVAMMGFMHFYMKFTQPLFIQGLMGIKNLLEAKPVALYIFNKPAEGDLKRPFKQPPGLLAVSCPLYLLEYLILITFAASNPATDKASIDAAEGKPKPKEE